MKCVSEKITYDFEKEDLIDLIFVLKIGIKELINELIEKGEKGKKEIEEKIEKTVTNEHMQKYIKTTKYFISESKMRNI